MRLIGATNVTMRLIGASNATMRLIGTGELAYISQCLRQVKGKTPGLTETSGGCLSVNQQNFQIQKL